MHQNEKAEVTTHLPHPQSLAVTFVGDNALGFLWDSVLPRAPAFFSLCTLLYLLNNICF